MILLSSGQLIYYLYSKVFIFKRKCINFFVQLISMFQSLVPKNGYVRYILYNTLMMEIDIYVENYN